MSDIKIEQQGIVLRYLTVGFVFYNLAVVGNLTSALGYFIPNQIHSAISLGFALVIIYLCTSFSDSDDGPVGTKPKLLNYALVIPALCSLGYVVFFIDEIHRYAMFGILDTKGLILATILILPLVEAVRRTTGWTLPILVICMILLTIFQRYLPGVLYGVGYGIDRILYGAFVGESGIFGLPLRVASQVLLIFLLIGAMMQASGAGKWFLRLALALAGWSAGGPAKAAVLASAMFGSISGSPSGNAATTGVFTIPLMKNVGYKGTFAAAVEAVASTGGQILPPVMGAIAFLMAEWIGMSYSAVVLAAFTPAILYFLIVFVSVHLQAKRDGLEPMPRSELPKVSEVMKEGWFYLIPLCALIYFLIIVGFPPGMAGILTLPFAIGVSFLSPDKENRLLPKNFALGCQRAVSSWVKIAAITGFVGILVGTLELSGLGIRLSDFILNVSAGNLILTLILVGLCSLILGMGLDSIPSYITLATLMAPTLIRLGVPDIAAHLFVVYWGLASFFTPPLCIAVYVTTSISGSPLWRTGFEAMRLGVASFIIPFAFVLNNGLLLMGTTGQIIWAISTAFVGAIFLASGLRGYAFSRLGVVSRVLVTSSGILMIGPGTISPLVGVTVAGIVMLLSFSKRPIPVKI